jgi:3-mercaptopyruvate sulfurtransferase SseA
MRLFISMVAALGLSVCALVACSPQDGSVPAAQTGSSSSAPTANGNTTAQTTKPAPATPADQPRRINIQETQAAIAAGNTVIVDVRDESTYKTSHIKGAISIPLSQVEQRAGELPKDKLIITYCA